MKSDYLDEIEARAEVIRVAISRASREVILEHKLRGDPIVIWQDGKVVWVPADEIVVPELPASDETE